MADSGRTWPFAQVVTGVIWRMFSKKSLPKSFNKHSGAQKRRVQNFF
jgi:hypothetical protein